MQNAKQSGARKTYGKITVDKVGPSLNSKRDEAQLRQAVVSEYPGIRPNNSLNSGLFDESEFGVPGQKFTEERVCWIPVPSGTTKEEVEKRLEQLTNARLIRILSLRPILTEEQTAAMERGLSKNPDGSLKTIEDYAEQQAVRERSEDGNGQKLTYKGHQQYRAIAFQDGKAGAVEDIDLREEDILDMQPVEMASFVEEKVL